MKLFVPSWQVPGTWLDNLEALDGEAWIEGIELLFFSWDDEARRLFEAEAERIAAFRKRFAFSLHLPDPLPRDAVDLVAATTGLVERYVFHPVPTAQAMEPLFAIAGHDRFSLEYTACDHFEASLSLFPGISICADTGRLLRNGANPEAWIAERVGSIRELHLHGARVSAKENRDHLPLAGDEVWLKPTLNLIRDLDCIVNLETFSLEATKASRDALKRWAP